MLKGSAKRARDVMTCDVVTAFPHSSLRYVAKLMARHQISGLPVVDEKNNVLGLVSETDLLTWSDAPGEKQAWWLDMLAEGYELAPDFLDVVQAEREKVREIMTTGVVSVDEDTPLADIAKLMVGKSVKRVPVLRDGKLVGIVSRGDLIRALAES